MAGKKYTCNLSEVNYVVHYKLHNHWDYKAFWNDDCTREFVRHLISEHHLEKTDYYIGKMVVMNTQGFMNGDNTALAQYKRL